jgi:hypothetical protein
MREVEWTRDTDKNKTIAIDGGPVGRSDGADCESESSRVGDLVRESRVRDGQEVSRLEM